MMHHFKSDPNIIVWFDLFSNNQHAAPDLDFNWWSTTFKSAIADFQHTVMILAPHDNPIPFQRAWCLYEILCTIESNCRFEVAMSASEQSCFISSIAKSIEPINATIALIDAEKSESFNPEDRIKIFDAVSRTIGFAKVNTLIFEKLRDWVVDVLKSALTNCNDSLQSLDLKQSLGDALMNQGKYDEALPLFTHCFDERKKAEGIDTPETLRSMSSLGTLLSNKGVTRRLIFSFWMCAHSV